NDVSTGAGLGGTGTWDTSSAVWFDGTNDVPWNNANGDVAIFLGTNVGNSAGPVSLSTGITASVIACNTTGYSIQGNALSVSTGQIIAGAGVTGTISSSLAGNGGLTKTGGGTVILANSTNSYTGGTGVAAGTLQLAADNGIPTTSAVTV